MTCNVPVAEAINTEAVLPERVQDALGLDLRLREPLLQPRDGRRWEQVEVASDAHPAGAADLDDGCVPPGGRCRRIPGHQLQRGVTINPLAEPITVDRPTLQHTRW